MTYLPDKEYHQLLKEKQDKYITNKKEEWKDKSSDKLFKAKDNSHSIIYLFDKPFKYSHNKHESTT